MIRYELVPNASLPINVNTITLMNRVATRQTAQRASFLLDVLSEKTPLVATHPLDAAGVSALSALEKTECYLAPNV